MIGKTNITSDQFLLLQDPLKNLNFKLVEKGEDLTKWESPYFVATFKKTNEGYVYTLKNRWRFYKNGGQDC